MTQALVAQSFDQTELDIMRRTVAAGISNDEFALFLQVCKGRGLNPFNKEIYALGGNGKKLQIQVGIDGFRLLAQRSGEYRGQLGPFYCGPDGKWKEEWLESTPPVAAKVGVLRAGFEHPVWSVARYAAYAGSTPVWQKMPELMLAKCAESLSLRRAFPDQCAGLYTVEEMGQAADGSERVTVDASPRPVQASPEIRERLNALYDAGKAAERWATRREMLGRMSEILAIDVTPENVYELTPDLLALVEEYVVREPAAF
jgi:phage recombination protein Bet